MKPVRIGCSGWVYKDWRGEFYPEKLPQRLWLEHYASIFDTVEINNTFYRLPTEAAVKGWSEQTPKGFEFTIKGSRYTTHIKRLLSFDKYSTRFFKVLEPLEAAGKLANILWQLPPNFKQDLDRLETALDVLDNRPGRHCFEFRNETWFNKDTYELLRSHDAALVTGDDPRFPFVTREVTASWAYVRFHRGAHGSAASTRRARSTHGAGASRHGGGTRTSTDTSTTTGKDSRRRTPSLCGVICYSLGLSGWPKPTATRRDRRCPGPAPGQGASGQGTCRARRPERR